MGFSMKQTIQNLGYPHGYGNLHVFIGHLGNPSANGWFQLTFLQLSMVRDPALWRAMVTWNGVGEMSLVTGGFLSHGGTPSYETRWWLGVPQVGSGNHYIHKQLPRILTRSLKLNSPEFSSRFVIEQTCLMHVLLLMSGFILYPDSVAILSLMTVGFIFHHL